MLAAGTTLGTCTTLAPPGIGGTGNVCPVEGPGCRRRGAIQVLIAEMAVVADSELHRHGAGNQVARPQRRPRLSVRPAPLEGAAA